MAKTHPKIFYGGQILSDFIFRDSVPQKEALYEISASFEFFPLFGHFWSILPVLVNKLLYIKFTRQVVNAGLKLTRRQFKDCYNN